jgi:putative Mg2+ transporter-C (MgtC) family protein
MLAAVQIPSLNWEEALLRIALAAVFGAAIGIEREIREREAGLRTHMLVSVGSCLFTITSAYGFHEFLVNGGAVIRADPTRIAAQIVTGIGFLGAGAIIRQGLAIRGLTTAATLWVVAAIGLAAGAGYYSAALITTLVVLFALWPLRIIAYRFIERPHERRLSVQLGPDATPSGIVETLERLGVHVEQFEVEEAEGVRMIELRVDLPRGVLPELVIRRLLMVEQVRMARWGQ